MLPLLFAAALSASPPADCKLDLAPGEAVIERQALPARDDTLEAVSVSEASSDEPSTRVLVFGGDCKVVFQRRFSSMTQARFSEGRLGRQPFLLVTTFGPGGSACHYDHLILAYGGDLYADDGVEPLAPQALGHSNMDGMFVGDLGRGQGPGLVTWSAWWGYEADEGHYSRHKYQIVTYRWRDGRFAGPTVRITSRKYDPSPEAVAKRLHFGFTDMTEQKRFGEC